MKSEIFTVTIDSIAFGGEGVGHLPDGRICFVRGAVPDDTAEIRLTADRRSFAKGEIVRLTAPSPRRIDPECPAYGRCPGCSYRALPYADELEQKQKQFEHFLTRGGLVPPERILPCFPAPGRDFQRTRLKLACEAGRAGYRGFDNRSLVEISNCRLAVPEINAALETRIAKKEIPDAGKLFFRAGKEAVAVFDSDAKPQRLITDFLPGFGDFSVPAHAFFQTNRAVGAELARRVAEAAKECAPKQLIELYCGVGVFSVVAAEASPELHCTGIEIDSDAIHAARLNAEAHGVEGRCRFFSGDAGKFRARLKNPDGAMLLVDPPRTGLAPGMTSEISAFAPEWIIYISCSPDTLRRDLERLPEYETLRSGMLDMFPGTAHFESFSLLKRKAV